MSDKWTKTEVTQHIDGDGQPTGEKTITYHNPSYPGYEIQSRKRNIPHANGVGHWSHTVYVAIHYGERIFYRMADATAWVEKRAAGEEGEINE